MCSSDLVKGEKVAAKCKACHTFDKGGADRTGPNQWGIVGSHVAHKEGFSYSGALQGKSKFKWNDANLDKWLQKPSGFAPGNKMGFAGIESKQERLDLISYLKANS